MYLPKKIDFSREELSNGDLGFIVALLVCLGIVFLCVCAGGANSAVVTKTKQYLDNNGSVFQGSNTTT